MNTYGLFSINSTTFNSYLEGDPVHSKEQRDIFVTVLRVNNLTFNILGYISRLSPISGCLRMGIGLGLIVTTLCIGNPDPKVDGPIIGRWYGEAWKTGITQVARGVLEAFVPFGSTVNIVLDVIATVYNFKTSFDVSLGHSKPGRQGNFRMNPDYNEIFYFLECV